jgi:hypothetical protein
MHSRTEQQNAAIRTHRHRWFGGGDNFFITAGGTLIDFPMRAF